MTGKERILKALALEQPDRVPKYVHAMNEPSIVQIGKLFAEKVPEVKPANQMNLMELLELAKLMMLIHEELEIDAITAVPFEDEVDIDDLRYRDPWGIIWERNPHGMPVPVGHPIKTEKDLEGYERPHPNSSTTFIAAQMMRAHFGESKALFFMVFGVFSWTWFLHGMEKTLIDCIRNPDLIKRLARMATDHCRETFEMAVAHGVDVVIIEDDIADKHSPLISPRHYKALFAPFHRELAAYAHELGLKIVMHTDGNIWPLLDDYVEAGFDGINPLEPLAGMDLQQVKERYGDKICLLGNIDCGELLCNGTTEEVEAAVKWAIDVAAKGGGYILCDSNTIHPGVNPENFITMMKTAHAVGKYS